MTSAPALLADVGGTRARFGLLGSDGRIRSRTQLRNSDFPTLAAACRDYLDSVETDAHPRVAAFAVAAPVAGDRIVMTTRAWSFSIQELRRELGLERLEVVNDFAALALALPRLGPSETRVIKAGRSVEGHPIALLGAGTGLGVAALVPHGRELLAVTTEGGHRDLAPTDEREWAVFRWLQARFGHVSVERVLSGPGLSNLHEAICGLDGIELDSVPSAGEVGEGAGAGDPVCLEAIRLFSGWLGAVAGDLALTFGARGGVYVGGGVVPRLGDLFDTDVFLRRFVGKGRFESYLEPVPVALVLRTESSLAGLAYWLSRPAR